MITNDLAIIMAKEIEASIIRLCMDMNPKMTMVGVPEDTTPKYRPGFFMIREGILKVLEKYIAEMEIDLSVNELDHNMLDKETITAIANDQLSYLVSSATKKIFESDEFVNKWTFKDEWSPYRKTIHRLAFIKANNIAKDSR